MANTPFPQPWKSLVFQALFIAPNTNLFLFPASLAPLFVLDATFSLTQVE